MVLQMPKKLSITIFSLTLILLIGWFANLNADHFTSRVLAEEAEWIESESVGGLRDRNLVLPFSGANEAREFVIEIQKIGLKRQVVENVDPANSQEYMGVLNHSIAHGKYTRLPDQAVESGNVYLFGHREGEYQGNDVGFFSRLDEVELGDEAIIKFDGNTYIYKFRSSRIVDPTETSVYTPFSSTPMLTLQTCEDGYSKRLILFFDFVGYY